MPNDPESMKPQCAGYPTCDGDLEAMPHDPGCPLYVKPESTQKPHFGYTEEEAAEECRTEGQLKRKE